MHRRNRIVVLREPDPTGIAEFVPDLFRASTQIIIAIWAFQISDLGPEILPKIARERNVGVGKREIFLGFGVERRSLGERDRLSVLLLYLLVQVRQVNDVFLVSRGRKFK